MAKTSQRPKVRSGRSGRVPLWLWVGGPLLAVVVVAGVYTIRASDRPGRASALDALSNDPGVTHVHGLGVNPANSDVYAATHMGVFRMTKQGKASRIANRYQDTMGFTVVGPNHFLASGHPDLREDLPPLLGLLESRNAGKSWIKKSLLGKADFHVLRYAHRTIYGYDSTGGAFMTSKDGRHWQRRSTPTIRDFAVSPDDRDVAFATTQLGLERSADGGRSWKAARSPEGPVLLAWESSHELWLVDGAGRVHLSKNGGKTWVTRGSSPGSPQAFLDGGDRLYVAVATGIYASSDGGRNWKLFFRDGEGH